VISNRLDATMSSDLYFFRVTAESSSRSAAALRLCVTQSAVSQRIQRLEDRLGHQLFQKVGRQQILTPVGQRLFKSCSAGFSTVEDALRELDQPPQTQVLRILCMQSLALEWLSMRLITFRLQHPDIEVELFADLYDIDASLMRSSGIDVLITYGPYPEKAPIAIEHPEDVFPVAAPSYLDHLKHDPNAAFSLLHDVEPWNGTIVPTVEWDIWRRARDLPWQGQRRDVYYNVALLAYRAAEAGQGIALGRKLIVSSLLENGSLVRADDSDPVNDIKVFVQTPDYDVSEATQLFLTWVKAELSAP